jgi:hypothetical protein
MQRKAIRATVGGVDVDIPIGTLTTNQLLRYDGTEIDGALLVDNSGNLTTGDILAIGNISTAFGGTIGGIDPSNHDARHLPGGADTMFPGTWAAGDEPVWNGTIWVPKVRQILEVTTQRTTASASLVDIPDLVLALPRAGTYYFKFDLATVIASAAATVFGFGVNHTGTVTRLNCNVIIATSATATALACAANNTAASASRSVTTVLPVTIEGSVVATTTGTLSARFLRTSGAATIGVNASSVGLVIEQ